MDGPGRVPRGDHFDLVADSFSHLRPQPGHRRLRPPAVQHGEARRCFALLGCQRHNGAGQDAGGQLLLLTDDG